MQIVFPQMPEHIDCYTYLRTCDISTFSQSLLLLTMELLLSVQWKDWREWYNIVLITLFNVGDFLGNALPLFVPIIRSQTNVLLWSILRMLFLPVFFVAIEVWTSPIWVMPLILAFGLSNG